MTDDYVYCELCEKKLHAPYLPRAVPVCDRCGKVYGIDCGLYVESVRREFARVVEKGDVDSPEFVRLERKLNYVRGLLDKRD